MADQHPVLQHEEIAQLLEKAEAAGFVEASDVADAIDQAELEPAELEALHQLLEERNIEVIEPKEQPPKEPTAPPRNTEVLETGRLKDIINRGGEKFSARDIEDAIALHPAVFEAAVVAAPHRR